MPCRHDVTDSFDDFLLYGFYTLSQHCMRKNACSVNANVNWQTDCAGTWPIGTTGSTCQTRSVGYRHNRTWKFCILLTHSVGQSPISSARQQPLAEHVRAKAEGYLLRRAYLRQFCAPVCLSVTVVFRDDETAKNIIATLSLCHF